MHNALVPNSDLGETDSHTKEVSVNAPLLRFPALLSVGILLTVAPSCLRATGILPSGISDMLIWNQPGGAISATFPEPANETIDEPPHSLGPFILANGLVTNVAAIGTTLDLAVVLIEPDPPPAVSSDIVIWHTTGMANSQQSISVEMDSDPHSLVFTATLISTMRELDTGNNLSSLFFTPAGMQAGFGLTAVSDIPEPQTFPLIAGVLLAAAAIGIWRQRRPA